jgi:hypothetical protein
MLLASGHHRIMAAARGALVVMVLGKVLEFLSTTRQCFQERRTWLEAKTRWHYFVARLWSVWY